jgi:hypothetical protein
MPNEFTGRGEALSAAGLSGLAGQIGVGLTEIRSVIQVETSGSGFFANRKPKILFERHIFSAQTKGQFDASHPGISDPVQGGYTGGPAEYDRLAEAIGLDRKAALMSASWGIGQVMGFNFAVGGFADVESMVAAMPVSEDRQMEAMVGFIRGNNIAGALKTHDWLAFATVYNGSGNAPHYAGKLQDAFAALDTGVGPDLRIRAAQLYLTYHGINPHGIDGVAGGNTKAAIKAFQTKAGLPATGELDDVTFAKLAEILDTVG